MFHVEDVLSSKENLSENMENFSLKVIARYSIDFFRAGKTGAGKSKETTQRHGSMEWRGTRGVGGMDGYDIKCH